MDIINRSPLVGLVVGAGGTRGCALHLGRPYPARMGPDRRRAPWETVEDSDPLGRAEKRSRRAQVPPRDHGRAVGVDAVLHCPREVVVFREAQEWRGRLFTGRARRRPVWEFPLAPSDCTRPDSLTCSRRPPAVAPSGIRRKVATAAILRRTWPSWRRSAASSRLV